VLETGLFKPVYWQNGGPLYAANWERAVPEEGTVVNVSLSGETLELNISPAISVFAHHAGKRLAAGICFEIAAKYAEKVGGQILQRATVVGCKSGERSQELLIANYPGLPMSFDRICTGFQTVLLDSGGGGEFARHIA
jgi:hypothetical protein